MPRLIYGRAVFKLTQQEQAPIIKVYQEEGRVGKKQKRNKVVDLVEIVTVLEEHSEGVRPLIEAKVQESKFSFDRDENYSDKLMNQCQEKAQKEG